MPPDLLDAIRLAWLDVRGQSDSLGDPPPRARPQVTPARAKAAARAKARAVAQAIPGFEPSAAGSLDQWWDLPEDEAAAELDEEEEIEGEEEFDEAAHPGGSPPDLGRTLRFLRLARERVSMAP